MSRDGFLARWSRRKLDPIDDASDPAAADAAPPPKVEEPVETAECEIAPEELADLPSVEELTAETDLSGFLRPGIPIGLRNAALRRIWSLDPAIRDHVGDARDYAWDWNVPDGVPGSGPLASLDDIGARVLRMLSTGEGATPARSSDAEVAAPRPEPDGPAALEPPDDPCRDEKTAALPQPAPTDDEATDAPLLLPDASPEPAGAEPEPPHQPRRHGTAIPKFDLF
ncbi:MAG: DUF3306 domain-containing protein [Methylobacteriaceae bacterium]|nr:DUF3306 domain-containing protein [Methylobacteriaceae bacterium]